MFRADTRCALVLLLASAAACSSATPKDEGPLCDVGDEAPAPYVSTTGPSGGAPYDGPAVVERSTPDDLVLAVSTPDLPAGDPQRHVKVSGLSPMPILPPGARVWLTKNRAGEQVEPRMSHGTLPWAISVRNAQGGRLMFGALHNTTDAVGVPVTVGAVEELCAMSYPQACHYGDVVPTLHFRSVEIVGDTTVRIATGHTASVAIGGADYDVSVRAELLTDAHDGCGDNWGLETLDIAVQAHDLADLVARVEVGEPPACGNGNQPLRYVSMLMQDDVKAISANYDGRAVYPGPNPDYPAYLDFELPDFTGPFEGKMHLLTIGLEPLVGTPAKGTTYWASVGDNRRSGSYGSRRGGPSSPRAPGRQVPLPAAQTADLEALLGVTVDVVQRCTYTIESWSSRAVPLWEVVLGTTPPTHVPAGGTGTLEIGGKPYAVDVQGIDTLAIVVHPAR